MEDLLVDLREALLSGNAIAWLVAVLLLIVLLKLVHRAGKGFVMLIALILAIAGIATFFPELLAPLVDFVRGGWLGEHRPFEPN